MDVGGNPSSLMIKLCVYLLIHKATLQYILVKINAENGWMEMVKEKIITINDSRYRPRLRVEPSEAAGSNLIL
jgi:hypothetical protein